MTEPSYEAEAEVSPGEWQPVTLDVKASVWFDTDFINMPGPGAYLGGVNGAADAVPAGQPA